jgi:hypothetical protein
LGLRVLRGLAAGDIPQEFADVGPRHCADPPSAEQRADVALDTALVGDDGRRLLVVDTLGEIFVAKLRHCDFGPNACSRCPVSQIISFIDTIPSRLSGRGP